MKIMKKIILKYLMMAIACSLPSLNGAPIVSKYWKDFVKAKKEGREAILMDYSFAGYKRGEKAIPNVKGKVFNVKDYGAKPNDKRDDVKGIQKALDAASKNGGGIVYLPRGVYYISTKKGVTSTLLHGNGGNIVMRGDGAGKNGTKIFMKYNLDTKTPQNKWTSPYMIAFNGNARGPKISQGVTADAVRGAFKLKVEDGSKYKKDMYISLSVNNKQANEYLLGGLPCNSSWGIVKNGRGIFEYHKIKAIKGNELEFYEPLLLRVDKKYNWKVTSTYFSTGVGVEKIHFVGNFKEKFVHHKNALHDGGWSVLKFNKLADSWIRYCKFTNVNRSIAVSGSMNVSMLMNIIDGNTGHATYDMLYSSFCFVGLCSANVKPSAGGAHGPNTQSASGNVIWRFESSPHIGVDFHAGYPYTTLWDATYSGLISNGGAAGNLPNHGLGLVWWNRRIKGTLNNDFDFWRYKQRYGALAVKPLVVGLKFERKVDGTLKNAEVESLGEFVKPFSLYEYQLLFRSDNKKFPPWVIKAKKSWKRFQKYAK